MTAIAWTLLFLFVLMVAILIWREFTHDKERKDLYNRLMAKDYHEYVTNEPSKKPPKSVNPILKRQKELEKAGE